MIAGKDMMGHERCRCGQHEAVAHPQQMRQAPNQLPGILWMPGDACDACLPQMDLRLIYRSYLWSSASVPCMTADLQTC